jgi:uncharacterized protein YecE (DUF72 family)
MFQWFIGVDLPKERVEAVLLAATHGLAASNDSNRKLFRKYGAGAAKSRRRLHRRVSLARRGGGGMPIRVGIGGWVYAPWRGVFYPPGLVQARELGYASRRVTSIEINGTFYGAQKPASFRRWHAETPDDFVFALKGPRFATHRRALGESGPTIERFFASGVFELGAKLGPLLWQLPATTRFDKDNLAAFLALLPRQHEGRQIRHVIEAGHASFADAAWPALLRDFGVAAAIVDSDRHLLLVEKTADFYYCRLRRCQAEEATGYESRALDDWAERCRLWAAEGGRDGFVYFINGAKERAPAAAEALIARLAAAAPATTAKPAGG